MATVDGVGDSPSGIPGQDAFPTTLEPYLGAVLLESFLYGVYTILFSICSYVLMRRRRKIHWILPFFATGMYSLATADMAYTLWLLFGKLLKLDLDYQALRWKFWMYVTNNVLADTLLLYRCYVVWDYDKRVVLGPALLLVAATVCGYLFEGSLSTTLFANSWVYPLMTLILNLILTFLTASRIWFLSHRARKLLEPRLLQRYSVTLSILIESGLIYSLYMALDLAFHKDPSGSVILDASLIQIVGIMPTLIIAQIGVGRAVHDIEANFTMTNMETAQSGPSSTVISSKMEIQTPTTESMLSSPLSGIAIRVDTRKQTYDVALTPVLSPLKEDSGYPYEIGHNSTSSRETFVSRELYNSTHRYYPAYHQELSMDDQYYHHHKFVSRHGGVADLPHDIEKGDVDRYHETELANGCVLDYVLREDVPRGVVAPWEENGDNRTPLPRRQGSARLKKSRPTRSTSRE